MSRRHDPSDVAVHEFVQLLAGWVPDGKLSAVRRTLAEGQAAAAAAAAAGMAAEYDVPLLAEDIEAARSLAGEPGALGDVQPANSIRSFRFSSACSARTRTWKQTTWTG